MYETVRVGVLTVVTINITVLWDVTPCILVDPYQLRRNCLPISSGKFVTNASKEVTSIIIVKVLPP
jgi:hypothetical protein